MSLKEPLPPSPAHAALLAELEAGAAYGDVICEHLPKICEAITSDPAIRAAKFEVWKTKNKLKVPSEEMIGIFHSLPRKACISTIRGTVAFDADRSGMGWVSNHINLHVHWDKPTAGVYVIAFKRTGDKENRFLTQRESASVAEGMRKYVRGCQEIRLKNWTHASVQWVKDVDRNQKLKGKTTRYYEQLQNLADFTALAKMYDMRAGNVSIAAADDTQRQHQSPLYVGCSKQLQERLKIYNRASLRHKTETVSLPGNRGLCFTLAICTALGIELDLIDRVALTLTDDRLLPAAEILVCALADSLVLRRGFNATDAGGSKAFIMTNDQALNTLRNVIKNGELLANLNATLRIDEMRISFLNKYHTITQGMRRLKKVEEEASPPMVDELTPILEERREQATEEYLQQTKELRRVKVLHGLIAEVFPEMAAELGRGLFDVEDVDDE